MKKCEYIEAPVFEGSNGPGTEKAYKIIKNAIIKNDKHFFCDYTERVCFEEAKDEYGTKNIKEVLTKCENVRSNVLNSLSNGRFPIVVGGDHSVAMASIAAGSEYFGIDDYAVIYIDGHCDINTEKTSSSHNIHGMPLASSLGLCSDTLQVGNTKKKVNGENVYILGARSIDEPEYDIINNNNVHLFENKCFFTDFTNILMNIKDEIGKKKVHISFDVDVLDPSSFLSTYYLMENGLSIETVMTFFDFFFQNLNIVSADIVEYNPNQDIKKKDLNVVLSFIKKIEEYVACKK